MPETVTYDSESGIIHVRAWGHGTISQWRESVHEFDRLHAKHGATLILVDVREQISAPNIVDIFDFAGEIPVGRFRIAILVSERTREAQTFLEDAATNRGRAVKTFLTEKQAMEWLRLPMS